MEVILLEKVANLGNLGDKVKVKSGYGRNFLVPYGKAVPATGSNIEAFEKRRAELEKQAEERQSEAESRKQKLDGQTVTIAAKSGDEGKLFGSVSTREIADALVELDSNISRTEVKLPEGAIRNLGQYEIDVQLHSDVMATVTVNVVAQ
ncbi:50S ribosomal protein L9 [Allohahella sp. A8]|uniref:50S ribosomal protein L9 n=1 Tax=Allohahella sp. A8 TaxID=3141461 RepID=UPI000C09A725|nr:50S ribosomal protein L9 [Hahellaceae bacterium]|tara:strand:+ start:1861 stop:2307 length:447 start_codon:yes stop_codon:yes gene_type:complete